MDVFNAETHQGNFRQLTVRVGQATGDLMLVVGIHPQVSAESNLIKKQIKIFNFLGTFC
jgi:tRNA (uracil-5-)-methyltransferase